ncbi:hypothetical protein AGMMS49579_04290 [Spirochaetia bacterium]|nr:hypothetical protein AGMMS49579_04290 [Spirochaetia bacterium]
MKNIKNLIFCGLIALAAVITFAGCTTTRGSGNEEITLDPPKSDLYIGNATTPESAAGTTLASNLEWLRSKALDNTAYTIKLNASGSIGDIELRRGRLNNMNNVGITLTTAGQAEVIIALKSTGSPSRMTRQL